MLGAVPTVEPQLSGEFDDADGAGPTQRRRLKVRTNAETPDDARTARRFGAEGIGLCRTEHMFFDDERIVAMREMILAGDAEAGARRWPRSCRCSAQDFAELFEIMAGLPVTIRLLDPPLHEFLPDEPRRSRRSRAPPGVEAAAVRRRAAELREANPMLGLRGCRLGVLFPEIYEMQARAIFGAAVDVAKAGGQTVVPEIMVPLIATTRELELIKTAIDAVAEGGDGRDGPRDRLSGRHHDRGAARGAARRARSPRLAEFFSFGTNDLTQMALGLSRDDSGQVHGALSAARHLRGRSVLDPGRRRRRRAGRAGLRARPARPAGSQARHLRRARRRSGDHRVLRAGRARLRLLLALPRADRAAGGGPGGPGVEKASEFGAGQRCAAGAASRRRQAGHGAARSRGSRRRRASPTTLALLDAAPGRRRARM